jgi:hypothetical protein
VHRLVELARQVVRLDESVAHERANGGVQRHAVMRIS